MTEFNELTRDKLGEINLTLTKKEMQVPITKSFENTQLTQEEQKMIDDFAEKIDITNSTQILQYGVSAQKKLANFSDTTLNTIKTKDLGEVGARNSLN